MKMYRTAVILVVVMALLAGGLWFISVKNNELKDKPSDKDKENKTQESILSLDSNNIKEIVIDNKSDKIKIQKKDNDWTVVIPENFNADKTKTSTIATNLASLTADRVIAEEASDLAQFGLDKPAVVTINMNDGSSKVLQIGNATITDDGYYVKLKDSNKVYKVLKTTLKDVMDKLEDWRDKKLFAFKKDDIIKFNLKKGDSTVFELYKGPNSEWKVLKPVETKADSSSVGSMLDSIVSVNVASFEDDNPKDLGKFGLDKPRYAVYIETANAKKTLYIGNEKTKGEDFYAKTDSSKSVYTLKSSSFTFLDKNAEDIMEKYVYIENINDVSKLEAQIDANKVEVDIETNKDDSSQDKFTSNGKDAGMKDENGNVIFKSFYEALVGMKFSSIDLNAKPSGKPVMTFKYTLKKSPGTVKIELVPKDDRYFYVLKDGKYNGMIVDGESLNGDSGLKKKFNDFKEALDKQ